MRTIGRFSIQLRGSNQLVPGNPLLQVGDFLGRGDDHVLAVLDSLDECRGLHQAVYRAGVQPGEATAEDLHLQSLFLKIKPVEVGDLQFAARGGPDLVRHPRDAWRIEVQSGDAVVALGNLGLLLDRKHAPPPVELHDAEALRVLHVVAEDGRMV